MYAVVKTGGKQLKVEVGETVSVELLDATVGTAVTLPALLINDGTDVVTGEAAAKATVTAEVLGHGQGDKVLIFKFKKRKGYKRTRGHRQDLTLVKVTDIALEGAKKATKAAAKPAVEATAEVAETPKKPAAKKPAAKKSIEAGTEKKPAAKKPAAKKTTKPAESAE